VKFEADIREMCRDGKCDSERVLWEWELAVAREGMLTKKIGPGQQNMGLKGVSYGS